jgi:hypothetical protein
MIESLRICSNGKTGCTGCGCYNEKHDVSCIRKLSSEAADRLEELQAENERLKRKATGDLEDWVDD